MCQIQYIGILMVWYEDFSGNFYVFVCVFLQRTQGWLQTGGPSPTRKFWEVVLLLQPASLSTGWVNSRRRNSLVRDKLNFSLILYSANSHRRLQDERKYHSFSPPSLELLWTYFLNIFFPCHSYFSFHSVFLQSPDHIPDKIKMQIVPPIKSKIQEKKKEGGKMIRSWKNLCVK